jgi:hypothetical protein
MQAHHHLGYWLLLAAWQALENWLGRTALVRAGSLSELIFDAFESIVVWTYHKLK